MHLLGYFGHLHHLEHFGSVLGVYMPQKPSLGTLD